MSYIEDGIISPHYLGGKKMRGLCQNFIDDLQDGNLKNFLTAVQNDDTLCLEIRDNYVNIYYRGGNLCCIKVKNNAYDMKFEKKYAISDEHKNYIAELESWTPQEWVKHIPVLQSIMNSNRPPVENEFRQLVVWENNRSRICNDTDYYIADIEVFMQNSAGQPRYIDMVAFNWPSTSAEHRKKVNRRLALIEVKYGDKSLKDVAGILEHIKDWHDLVQDTKQLEELRDSALKTFNQKVELGLISKVPGKITSISQEKPELILLLINHKPASGALGAELQKVVDSDEYQALRKIGCDFKIATASHMGYGLYESCMISIEKLHKKS